MEHKKMTIERVVFLVSFLFISAAFVLTLFNPEDPESLIPYSKYVVLVVHGICALTCLFLVIKPVFSLSILVLLIESFITLNITYEQLGVFLFYVCYILLFCNGSLVHKFVTKTFFLFLFHLISLLGVISHGITKFVIAFGSSIFFLVMLLWIYNILKVRFSCIIPSAVTQNSLLKNKQPGSQLILSEFELTERQKNMILDNLQNNLSYKDLSEKYFVSLSTVKKDFSEIFRVFSVAKLEELHLLLMQYQVNK